MTTKTTDWYASENFAAFEALRAEADFWRRRAEFLEPLVGRLGNELADLKCQRDCRLVNQQSARGTEAMEADKRERVEWWTNLAFLVLGFGLGLVSAWRMGGME